MKRHALFVGVNTYDDPSIRPLRFSIPDASVLADRFGQLGFESRLLSDPTGSELLSAVEDCVSGLGPGDVFLFFFAGHGFTAQDGAHLLFCKNDRQRLLRVNNAGVRVDALEALTDDGGFHRAFLLDSCRTDCFAGAEARGVGTRDLDFVAMPTSTAGSGSFYLLRSCDKFRPSLELADLGHGLFTQGLLDAMDARDGRLAVCDTSFAAAVRDRMEELQRLHEVPEPQRPSLGEVSGTCFALFKEGFLRTEQAAPSVYATPATAFVVCPLCGKKNRPEDTFKCRECGCDNLCLSHFDSVSRRCESCASKQHRADEALKLYMDGLAFEEGAICPCDPQRAIEMFQQSANLGNPEAQCKIGDFYCKGYGGKAFDMDSAIEWWRKSVEGGCPYAMLALGECFERGKGIARNAKEASRLYAQAFAELKRRADVNDSNAQHALAKCYRMGRGTASNMTLAAFWCRKAADSGNFAAMIDCAQTSEYELEDETRQKFCDESREMMLKRAENGNSDCQILAAEFHFSKDLEDPSDDDADIKEGLVWLEKAVAKGNRVAMRKLGLRLLTDDCPKYFDRAFRLMKDAASRGDDEVLYHLGLCQLIKATTNWHWFERKNPATDALQSWEASVACGLGKEDGNDDWLVWVESSVYAKITLEKFRAISERSGELVACAIVARDCIDEIGYASSDSEQGELAPLCDIIGNKNVKFDIEDARLAAGYFHDAAEKCLKCNDPSSAQKYSTKALYIFNEEGELRGSLFLDYARSSLDLGDLEDIDAFCMSAYNCFEKMTTDAGSDQHAVSRGVAGEAESLYLLAIVESRHGRAEQARQVFDESRSLFKSLGHNLTEPVSESPAFKVVEASFRIAVCLAAENRMSEALREAHESLATLRCLENEWLADNNMSPAGNSIYEKIRSISDAASKEIFKNEDKTAISSLEKEISDFIASNQMAAGESSVNSSREEPIAESVENEFGNDAESETAAVDDEIHDTDIVFDCPYCGHGLVIDSRGAGMVIKCTTCGGNVTVPHPDEPERQSGHNAGIR